ncbi:MAG: hypothetical protein PVJ21_16705 [Anaerolineales bacterium]|jgi:hypothetical protein
MSENAIIIPGEGSEALSLARQSFRQQLDAAAQQNVAELAEQGYTPLEIRAVQKVEQLRLLGGFELVTLLERGALFQEIEREGLAGVYPGDATTLEEICQEIGISKSEYSDTRGLCEVVFPWLEENTEQSLQEWWEQIGKSKFRELLPVLRGLIEGASARNHDTVNEAIQAQLENALEGILAEASVTAGGELPADEAALIEQAAHDNGTVQQRAILNVLEFGSLPVREMRQQVRPSRTPNIYATVLRGHTSFAVLRMSPEQLEMFERLMGTHVDAAILMGNDYPDHVRLLGQIIPE